MNRTEMAAAYRNIGVAFLQAAEVLEGAETVTTPEPPEAGLQPLQPMQAPVASPPPPLAATSGATCPIHGEELRPSSYAGKPAYCPRKGGDPAWTNQRGYCTINSDNVGQYLAIQQRAAATR